MAPATLPARAAGAVSDPPPGRAVGEGEVHEVLAHAWDLEVVDLPRLIDVP